MPAVDTTISNLQHAYRVLDVPHFATAPVIKKSYRRLAQRWHPDRYLAGTPSHAKATEMMRLVNEAYARIKDAPLRYHRATYVATHPRTQQTGQGRRQPPPARHEEPAHSGWFEFWLRFVVGAVFGSFVGFRVSVYLYENPFLLVLCWIGLTLGIGYLAARYGDSFWYEIFSHWWLWR